MTHLTRLFRPSTKAVIRQRRTMRGLRLGILLTFIGFVGFCLLFIIFQNT